MSVDSQELVGENGAATNVLDGNPQRPSGIPNGPHDRPPPASLVLDLGAAIRSMAFFLPRQDGSPKAPSLAYQFYVSDDGVTWGTAGRLVRSPPTLARKLCASRPKPAALCASSPCRK